MIYRRPSGFTLLELLVVIVVIGILGAFALSAYFDAEEEAYVNAMRNDLRNFAGASETYHADHGTYVTPEDLEDADRGFGFSPDVQEDSVDIRSDGFFLRLSHEKTDVQCRLNYGTEAGADNRIRCPGDPGASDGDGEEEGEEEPVADWDAEPADTPEDDGAGALAGSAEVTGSFAGDAGPPDDLREKRRERGVFARGEAIRFDARNSYHPDPEGEIAFYEWDFTGDGEADEVTTEPIIEQSFDMTGVAQVELTVIDTEGRGGSEPGDLEFIESSSPEAAWEADPAAPDAGVEVSFLNHSSDPDGSELDYHWGFGDGATSVDEAPAHTYASTGRYDVELWVMNEAGQVDHATGVLNVGELPSDGLVGHWTVCDQWGGSEFRDIEGGNHGWFVQDEDPIWDAEARSLRFTPSEQDGVALPTDGSSDSFPLTMVFQYRQDEGSQGGFDGNGRFINAGWAADLHVSFPSGHGDPSTLPFEFRDGLEAVTDPPPGPWDEEVWRTVAFVFVDSNHVRVYQDGTLFFDDSDIDGSGMSPFISGREAWIMSGEEMQGYIPDILWYDRELSEDEVQTVHDFLVGGTCPVTDAPDDLVIEPDPAKLTVGEEFRLNAFHLDSEGNKSLVTDGLFWSGSNTRVASVSSDGVVAGLEEGTTTVSVTDQASNFTAEATVEVRDTDMPLGGPDHHWTVCAGWGGDEFVDVEGGLHGDLEGNNESPVWDEASGALRFNYGEAQTVLIPTPQEADFPVSYVFDYRHDPGPQATGRSNAFFNALNAAALRFSWDDETSTSPIRISHQGCCYTSRYTRTTGSAPSPWDNGEWRTIGITLEHREHLKIYRDGSLFYEDRDVPITMQPFDNDDEIFFMVGDIQGYVRDLVRYDRPLDDSEMAEIHDFLVSGACEAHADDVEELEVDPASAELAEGADVELRAYHVEEDGSRFQVTEGIEWSSSDASIAAVDDEGVVTGEAVGEVTITATDSEGREAMAEIQVESVALPHGATNHWTVCSGWGGTEFIDVIGGEHGWFGGGDGGPTWDSESGALYSAYERRESTLLPTPDEADFPVTYILQYRQDAGPQATGRFNPILNGLRPAALRFSMDEDASDSPIRISHQSYDPDTGSSSTRYTRTTGRPPNDWDDGGWRTVGITLRNPTHLEIYQDGALFYEDADVPIEMTPFDDYPEFFVTGGDLHGYVRALVRYDRELTSSQHELVHDFLVSETCRTGEVVDLEVEPSSLELAPGQVRSVDAYRIDEDGHEFIVTSEVEWSSDDPSIASVDAEGAVTSEAEGMTTLTAEDVEEGLEAQAVVHVDEDFEAPLDLTFEGNGFGTVHYTWLDDEDEFLGSGDVSESIGLTAPEEAATAELVRSAEEGSDFVDWKGDGSGDQPRVVAMDEPRSVIVRFDDEEEAALEGCTDPEAANYEEEADVDDGPCEYALDVVFDGTGSGTVRVDDHQGNELGTTATDTTYVLSPQEVELLASADEGSEFTAWSGDAADASGNLASLRTDRPREAVAVFDEEGEGGSLSVDLLHTSCQAEPDGPGYDHTFVAEPTYTGDEEDLQYSFTNTSGVIDFEQDREAYYVNGVDPAIDDFDVTVTVEETDGSLQASTTINVPADC